MAITLTKELAKTVLNVVDEGLCVGVGVPIPGKMCVEAAVCYALGLPHGDDPECVGKSVRAFKIGINDATWSSDMARAKGLRVISVCQLGSNEIDQAAFMSRVFDGVFKRIMPRILTKADLHSAADICAKAEGDAEVLAAARNAYGVAVDLYYSTPPGRSSSVVSLVRGAARSSVKSAEARCSLTSDYSTSVADWTSAIVRVGSAILQTEADSILGLAAEIGVEALEKCNCKGVGLWKQLQVEV